MHAVIRNKWLLEEMSNVRKAPLHKRDLILPFALRYWLPHVWDFWRFFGFFDFSCAERPVLW